MNKTRLYSLIIIGLLAVGVAAFTSGRLYHLNAAKAADLNTPPVDADGLHGTAFKPPLYIRPITLQHVEQALQLGDLQGNIVLIFFGYTHCPDICPFTMSKLASIYRELDEPKDVKVVMISVDPETDTPDVIQRYASTFHPSFIGLSGSNTQVAKAVQTFYVARNKLSETQVIHTSAVYLLDRQGWVRRVYSEEAIMQLQNDVPIVLVRQDY
jgi:protein SCO1